MAENIPPLSPNPKVAEKICALSDINLDKIYLTVLDIEYKLEIAVTNVVSITCAFDHSSKQIQESDFIGTSIKDEYRIDALNKLEQWGIIEPPSDGQDPIDAFNHNDPTKFKIAVNVEHLKAFRLFLESIRNQRKLAPPIGPLFSSSMNIEEPMCEPAERQANQTDVIYEVRYTPAREVILNNLLLTKVDFNSENDNIFNFLFKNPNRIVTPDELSKVLGGEPKKSLHKVVENLGFNGDLKTVFFNISKTGLLFRNPITQATLQDLGMKWAKVPQK